MIKNIIILFWVAIVISWVDHASAADIKLTWDAPTQNEDGSTITQIDGYNIYHTINNNESNVITLGNVTEHTIKNVNNSSHIFQISTIANSLESELSDPVSATVNESKPVKIKLTVEVVQ